MPIEKAFFVSYFWQDMDGKQGYGWCDITISQPMTANVLKDLVKLQKDKHKFDDIIILTFKELEQPDEATVIANDCTYTASIKALMKALRKIRKVTRNHRSSSCAVVEIDDIVSPFLDKAIQIGGSNRG